MSFWVEPSSPSYIGLAVPIDSQRSFPPDAENEVTDIETSNLRSSGDIRIFGDKYHLFAQLISDHYTHLQTL
jgi:hypothetical protein